MSQIAYVNAMPKKLLYTRLIYIQTAKKSMTASKRNNPVCIFPLL